VKACSVKKAKEKIVFNAIWNKELSLKENQNNLVNEFLNQCVDFSFSLTEKNDYLCTRETNSIQFVCNDSNPIALLRILNI
jgi:hypothetical protein